VTRAYFTLKKNKNMNNETLTAKADLIWSTINTIENQNKNKVDQIELIKAVLLDISDEERRIGRLSVIQHIQAQLKTIQ
jgi:hypothetical protein